MTPAEFEYLIRKTITYLDFHSDDTARELVAEWQQVFLQIQQMKRRGNRGASPQQGDRSH
jgi:hypothetical protein